MEFTTVECDVDWESATSEDVCFEAGDYNPDQRFDIQVKDGRIRFTTDDAPDLWIEVDMCRFRTIARPRPPPPSPVRMSTTELLDLICKMQIQQQAKIVQMVQRHFVHKITFDDLENLLTELDQGTLDELQAFVF